MLYSLDSSSCEFYVSFGFDRNSGGFIITLPDWIVGLLRLKCEADQVFLVALILALEPEQFGQLCHKR